MYGAGNEEQEGGAGARALCARGRARKEDERPVKEGGVPCGVIGVVLSVAPRRRGRDRAATYARDARLALRQRHELGGAACGLALPAGGQKEQRLGRGAPRTATSVSATDADIVDVVGIGILWTMHCTLY